MNNKWRTGVKPLNKPLRKRGPPQRRKRQIQAAAATISAAVGPKRSNYMQKKVGIGQVYTNMHMKSTRRERN
eukprot:15832649-Heterocapsa_arctica.AAC.1